MRGCSQQQRRCADQASAINAEQRHRRQPARRNIAKARSIMDHKCYSAPPPVRARATCVRRNSVCVATAVKSPHRHRRDASEQSASGIHGRISGPPQGHDRDWFGFVDHCKADSQRHRGQSTRSARPVFNRSPRPACHPCSRPRPT
jgi:hypothetical protein